MNAPVEVLGLINHDAERAVLAAMRDDSTAAIDLAERLEPADFYDTRRQIVFAAMANLLVRPDMIDVAAIEAECMAVAEIRGSTVRITKNDIRNLDGDKQHVALQANTVKRLGWLRRASEFSFWLVEQVQTRPDPEALFTEAQEQWQQLSPPDSNVDFVYGWDTRGIHAEALKRRIREHEEGIAVPFDWPWQSWNRVIRPLRGGFLGLLAAADGQGKTTYLEQIAEFWAYKELHVVYVHLEDALDYKLNRRLARNARVAIDSLEDGAIDPFDNDRIREANKRLNRLAPFLHYYHAAGQTMSTIVRELESKVREGVCQVVVFDYLDKVAPTRTQSKLYGDNIWERQGADMEALKTFAEQQNLPVLTATQGNKSMQNTGIQTRQAIQGSGQKSQKSQLVIILSRDIVGVDGLRDNTGNLIADEGEYSPIVNVRIDKQNRGKTGQLQQVLIGKYFSVADIERKPQEAD